MIVKVGREVKTLSPTSLAAWLRCGGDWYNRYVLKSDRGGTWNMMAGNIIHLGANLHHEGKDWKGPMADFYEEHKDILSHPDAPSLEKFYTMMRIYALKNPRQEGDRPEEYFKINLEGLEQPLTGIFDLLRDDGIIELKTGGWWTQARVDLAMQTVHYSLAYKLMYGRMPKFFKYYWFDFEHTRVKEIATGVCEEDLNDFVGWLKSIVVNMQNGLVVTRCLFKDNKQTCWYPEQCGTILEENRKRAIRIEQREPSSESPKKRRKSKAVSSGSGDTDGGRT